MKRSSPPRKKPEAKGASQVEAYLASLPDEVRAALQEMRNAIRAAAPDAEEGFSYGLPAFRLGGRPLVCYGAWKDHCSFYPMSSALLARHARDLKGFETSKGTIRFSTEKPLPASVIEKVVKARVAELRKPKAKAARRR